MMGFVASCFYQILSLLDSVSTDPINADYEKDLTQIMTPLNKIMMACAPNQQLLYRYFEADTQFAKPSQEKQENWIMWKSRFPDVQSCYK